MADRVLPIVTLVFPCQQAQLESGDVIILNPWASVALPDGVSFPIDLEELWIFAQLTDGVGTFKVSVEMRRRFDDGTVQAVGDSPLITLSFPGGGQLGVQDAIFRMTNVPFDDPGLYEFILMADGEELDCQVPVLRVFDQRATP
jgi:hypothetical protein